MLTGVIYLQSYSVITCHDNDIGYKSLTGVMKHVGKALREHTLRSRHKINAIGVVSWGIVDGNTELEDKKHKQHSVSYTIEIIPSSTRWYEFYPALSYFFECVSICHLSYE